MAFPDVPDFPGVPPLPRDPSIAFALPTPLTANTVVSFATTAQRLAGGDLSGVVTGTVDTLLGGGDDFLSESDLQTDRWGLFDADGQVVLRPTSFLGLEYRNSQRVSNYPLEQGAFESYNKVADPFDLVVGLAHGGNLGERADFLATVLELSKTLDTYTLVTPEETFESVNIQRYDYARKLHNGAGLIVVNLYLTEIRINTESEFTNQDENAPTVDEAQDATTAETSDTAADATSLPESEVRNPASASAESQGQTQARPATAQQAAAASGTPATLPTGYTQEEDTGLVIRPDGFVDEEWSIRVGAKSLAK